MRKMDKVKKEMEKIKKKELLLEKIRINEKMRDVFTSTNGYRKEIHNGIRSLISLVISYELNEVELDDLYMTYKENFKKEETMDFILECILKNKNVSTNILRWVIEEKPKRVNISKFLIENLGKVEDFDLFKRAVISIDNGDTISREVMENIVSKDDGEKRIGWMFSNGSYVVLKSAEFYYKFLPRDIKEEIIKNLAKLKESEGITDSRLDRNMELLKIISRQEKDKILLKDISDKGLLNIGVYFSRGIKKKAEIDIAHEAIKSLILETKRMKPTKYPDMSSHYAVSNVRWYLENCSDKNKLDILSCIVGKGLPLNNIERYIKSMCVKCGKKTYRDICRAAMSITEKEGKLDILSIIRVEKTHTMLDVVDLDSDIRVFVYKKLKDLTERELGVIRTTGIKGYSKLTGAKKAASTELRIKTLEELRNTMTLEEKALLSL